MNDVNRNLSLAGKKAESKTEKVTARFTKSEKRMLDEIARDDVRDVSNMARKFILEGMHARIAETSVER